MDNNKKEIMTLEEVAVYLRLPEKEVLDLVQKGELPGGKFGDTWRFKGEEIESWASKKTSPRLNNNNIKSVELFSILSIDRIVFIKESSKKDALNQMIDLFLSVKEIKDRDEIAGEIFKREQLMSTGIGLSIAVPHARLNSIKDVYMAIGICSDEIIDYESLDSEPVRIIVMILAGRNQHAQYIQTLSQISRLLKEESTRKKLLESASKNDIYEIITGEKLV